MPSGRQQDSRPIAGSRHELRWPTNSFWSQLTFLVNRPLPRDILRAASTVLPTPTLASDIVDVVYLNWLVPRERVEHLLAAPLKLDCFENLTFVTVLTYRHRHFGPRFLGPLRRLMPSPHQSNWRLYVEPETPQRPRDAICFFKTVLDHGPLVFASRLLSDGLPSHRALRIEHERVGDRIRTRIDPGRGSAPDLDAEVQCGVSASLPTSMERVLGDWNSVVRYLVEQNRAIRVMPAMGSVHESRISIPIDLRTIEPASVAGRVHSRFLGPVIEDCEPFAFVVPAVAFRTLGEGWTATLSEAVHHSDVRP